MKQNRPFTIRFYGKSELALAYWPGLTKEVARKKLHTEIAKNPRLRHLLERSGHDYTPQQVELIVRELGEPDKSADDL